MVGIYVHNATFFFLYFLKFVSYFMNFLNRSDPTENDSVEGLRPNARGPGLVTFGVRNFLFVSYIISTFFILIITVFYCRYCT